MKLQYYILVAFEFFMRLAPKEVETDVGRRLLDYAEGVTRLLLENLLLVKINKESKGRRRLGKGKSKSLQDSQNNRL